MLFLVTLDILVLITLITVRGIEASFTYEFSPNISPLVDEGETTEFQLSISEIPEDVLIRAISSDEDVFRIVSKSEFKVRKSNQSSPARNQTLNMKLEAVFIGRARIEFNVTARDQFSTSNPFKISSYEVRSGARAQELRDASTYLLLAWLCISYATMGTTMDWSKIKPRLYRPHGIIIGIVCQFIIMPGLSSLIARLFSLSATSAVGLILVGTCPGGWLSNVYAALLDCDLVLSIIMTFFSTVLALGLMPLNIFIYATPFTSQDKHLQTPYRDLVIQLVSLVIPVFIGISIAYKFPKIARWISRLVKPFSAFIIIAALGGGVPTNIFLLRSPISLVFAATIYPMIGGLIGFFFAKLTCLANKSAITVALETGCQNSFLAITLVTLSYEQPESDLLGLAPILVAISTLIQGSLITIVYLCMRRMPGRTPEGEWVQTGNCGLCSRFKVALLRRFAKRESNSDAVEQEGAEEGNQHNSTGNDNLGYVPSISDNLDHPPTYVEATRIHPSK